MENAFCIGFARELTKLATDVTETAPSRPGALTFRAKQDRTFEETPKKDLSFSPSEMPRPAYEPKVGAKITPQPGRKRPRLDFWHNSAGQKGIKLVLPFGR